MSLEAYLKQNNIVLDKNIQKKIGDKRNDAINSSNEELANYYWALNQVYIIQDYYLKAFSQLKQKDYRNAWNSLDSADINIGFLEENPFVVLDDYHIPFIGKIIKEYQKLFPYRLFSSREGIIKKEHCSICNKVIRFRHPCGHKIGRVYMGRLCTAMIDEYEPLAIALVTDPFDKYCVLEPEGIEFNYSLLDHIMVSIDSPYNDFSVEVTKRKQQMFLKANRNDLCPCGSGIKYKKCHYGTRDELENHYIIHLRR